MKAKRVFDLADEPGRDVYKLLSGLVVPRPIGWIGTRGEDGSLNLAPFSFFNVVSVNPPTVLFAGGRHRDRAKDTVTLAEESGEFSVNIVSEEVAEAMHVTSATVDAEVDEFALAGLTPITGQSVKAPLVAESPANLECVVTRVVDVGESTRVIFGEVVVLHVSESVLDGTRIDLEALHAVGRMAGNTYTRTRDRFDLERPG